MADVFLDFRPRVGWPQVKKLEQVISEIGKNDQLVIMVEREDSHETDRLFAILDDNAFDYQPKTTGGEAEIYNIIARRKV